jgi:membrane associated rhomboid family serine protease
MKASRASFAAVMIPIRNSVPVRAPPIATAVLLGANVVVFLFQLSLSRRGQEMLLYLYGLVPARYADPNWAYRVGLSPSNYLPFVSSLFLHGGWLHLILNMWTLWLFGGAVEDRFGHARYLCFYLICGLAAGFTHYWTNADSTVPVVGASGAIAGVLAAYMALFPRSRIILLVPIVFIPLFFEMRAGFYVLLWFVLQLIQGTMGLLLPQTNEVAWWAHIGGFLAGLALTPIAYRPRSRYRRYQPDEGAPGFGPWGERQ